MKVARNSHCLTRKLEPFYVRRKSPAPMTSRARRPAKKTVDIFRNVIRVIFYHNIDRQAKEKDEQLFKMN